MPPNIGYFFDRAVWDNLTCTRLFFVDEAELLPKGTQEILERGAEG
jgi:hypothetical protein